MINSFAHTFMCTITRLKGVILIGESLHYRLVQEPSSYVVLGLRYEGKYKLRSIISPYATVIVVAHATVIVVAHTPAALHSITNCRICTPDSAIYSLRGFTTAGVHV